MAEIMSWQIVRNRRARRTEMRHHEDSDKPQGNDNQNQNEENPLPMASFARLLLWNHHLVGLLLRIVIAIKTKANIQLVTSKAFTAGSAQYIVSL